MAQAPEHDGDEISDFGNNDPGQSAGPGKPQTGQAPDNTSPTNQIGRSGWLSLLDDPQRNMDKHVASLIKGIYTRRQ